MKPRPFIAVGSGVTRLVTPTDADEQQPVPVPKMPEVERDATGAPVWHEDPTIENQLNILPHTCKLGPLHVRVFNLSDETQLTQLNEIYAKSGYMTSPRGMRIVDEEKKFYNGNWRIMLKCQTVHYQKLLPSAST